MGSIAAKHRQLSGYVVVVGLAILTTGVTLWAFWNRLPEQTSPISKAPVAATTVVPQTPVVLPPNSVRLASDAIRVAAGIQVDTVETRPLTSKITANGTVAFNQNKYVEVPPRVDGILDKINVDVGATVTEGDILCVIESQAVGELKADLVKSVLNEEHLRWTIGRFKTAGQGVPMKDLVEAQKSLDEQVTDTARIKDRLRTLGLSLAQLDEILKTRDISIELHVPAPRSGVVVMRDAVEGEPVLADHSMFEIADLGTMWVELQVYEFNLPFLRLGQSVEFVPDGLRDRDYQGSVTWISPEVDATTRTIPVRAVLKNSDGGLRANMVGRGELPIDEMHERLVVPQSAVQTHLGRHVVFIELPDNVFQMRNVSIGLKDHQYWEVTKGLKPGERVATIGSFLLKSNLENPDFGETE